MKSIFVINELTYADYTGTAPSRIDLATNLKKGAIAFYDETGTLIAHNASSVSGSTFTIVQGLGSGKVRVSGSIPMASLHYVATVYAAQVNKVMHIGGNGADTTYNLNLPSTITAGSVAVVNVHNGTKQDKLKPYDNYVIPIAVGDSEATVISKVIAQVNSDVNRIVTASSLTGGGFTSGIKFTGIKGDNFFITVGGILANADILEHNMINGVVSAYTAAGVTKYVKGNGTTAQVLSDEKQFNAIRGDGNYKSYNDEIYTPEYLATAGVLYTQYHLTYKEEANTLTKHHPFIGDVTIYTIPTAGTATYSNVAIPAILALLV